MASIGKVALHRLGDQLRFRGIPLVVRIFGFRMPLLAIARRIYVGTAHEHQARDALERGPEHGFDAGLLQGIHVWTGVPCVTRDRYYSLHA